MKKLPIAFILTAGLYFSACSNEKTSTNTESGNASEAATANDSSTTNPINSEYGTPNSSENPVDSAQDANQENTPQ